MAWRGNHQEFRRYEELGESSSSAYSEFMDRGARHSPGYNKFRYGGPRNPRFIGFRGTGRGYNNGSVQRRGKDSHYGYSSSSKSHSFQESDKKKFDRNLTEKKRIKLEQRLDYLKRKPSKKQKKKILQILLLNASAANGNNTEVNSSQVAAGQPLAKSTDDENQKQSSETTTSTFATTKLSKGVSTVPFLESSESESDDSSDQESRREPNSKRYTQEEIRNIIKQRTEGNRKIFDKPGAKRKFLQKRGGAHFSKRFKKGPVDDTKIRQIVWAIAKKNFPREDFTEEDIPEIRKQIKDEIATIPNGGKLPQIENTLYFGGTLFVYCCDDETVDWLRSTFNNKSIGLLNCTLKVVRSDLVMRRKNLWVTLKEELLGVPTNVDSSESK